MSATRILSSVLGLSVLLVTGTAPCLAAGSEVSRPQLPMSQDEIAAKRKAVREELMLPSLSGIRGIAYRVVGFKDYQPLEKLMLSKLEQLPITKIQLMKADGPYKDCDAVVQITFSKAGIHTIAELKVTQWVSLARNPKIIVRAVTYSDKVYSIGVKPEQSVEKLCNEFVIDFLKANQKGFDPEKSSNSQASGKKDSPAKSTKK